MLHKLIVANSMLGYLLPEELKRSSSNDVERDTQSAGIVVGQAKKRRAQRVKGQTTEGRGQRADWGLRIWELED